MNDRQERFIKLLENIFELDKSDLDFGIYRIMNIRRAEIEKFFKEGLPQRINETLAPFAGADSATIRKRMTEIETSLGGVEFIAQMPASVPMVAEYNELKKKLTEGVDISALESDVYSALYSFFSRYYDDGDFISKRRYKEGVYAIPYEGEEVKLYWANQDQYYIKTSENFKDYTFVTNEADGITVHFRLVDATTEQNNNKESDDKKRTFMLYAESEENPGLKTFEYDKDKRELIIRFVYDIPSNTKIKWHEANMKAINGWIAEHPELMSELLRNVSQKTNEHLSLIEKHLKGYVAKNTFDYFIHKDLGGFLRRELDFFIKNEVMHIDDIDTESETRVEAYLGKVRAIKRVGGVIIDFLAQVEEFQKRLWLKKKFVVETNYCITLDKIDERFYAEIAANEAQVKEWIEMYAINEVEGFTATPTIDFLRANQNLIVDTRHFDTLFKDKLIASIDNLDEQTNGVMINADNYQALKLLLEKYKGSVNTIYVDPPYNTDASKIIYKNGYEHSTWITLMESRLNVARDFLDNTGIIELAIDDYELRYINCCMEGVFGKENFISNIAIFTNPKGRDQGFVAQSHDYSVIYAKDKSNAKTNNFRLSDEELLKKFSKTNESGQSLRELPLKRTGTGKFREERPYMFFPFLFHIESQELSVIPEGEYKCIYNVDTHQFDDNYLQSLIEKYKSKGYAVILPISENGDYLRWRWGYNSCVNGVANGIIFCKCSKDKYSVYQYDMADNEFTPKSFWTGERYDASSKGTNLLNKIIPNNSFDYPKSLYTVEDNILLGSDSKGLILDFFAGSGTTGHAVIDLNRKDKSEGNRKYILVEMGEYFSKVTQPRIKKVVYASEWKDGKPKSRTTGVSHIMKYMRLESYEDALSNIELKKTGGISLFGEDYLINYMLNMESRDSLLNIDKFRSPFEYRMRITEKNECRERQVDVCETFNYLIGLSINSQSEISYFSAEKSSKGSYDGAVELRKDKDGIYGFRQIEGTLPDGRRALVIWRTITDDLLASNAALDAYFLKYRINPADREYDIIYVNGDNNLENLHIDEDKWKVVMIEKEFNEKMWEE